MWSDRMTDYGLRMTSKKEKVAALLSIIRHPSSVIRHPARSAPDQINEKFFLLTLLAAILLHIAGIYLWQLMPKQQTIDIPVLALSIKLGDGEPLPPEEAKPAQ